MKIFLSFQKKKKSLIAGYLEALIALLSFFLTATAESAGARKAPNSRRPDSGDGAKNTERKKNRCWGQEEREDETLFSPFSLLPLFFSPLLFLRHSPLSEHLEQASARTNAAIHKEFFFILLQEIPESVKNATEVV